MMFSKKMFSVIALMVFAFFASAQTQVTGTVTEASNGSSLPGVSIQVKGTTIGTSTDAQGKYRIEVPAGSNVLIFSFIGFETVEKEVTGSVIDVTMELQSFELSEIFIVADRARERETPVAFSNIDKKEIEEQLGSRDIPLVLNSTPGVYATAQGGGAGDARINIRGFNQRNVAVMINGVPMNDMENGWVYWSNWDGLADATSSIQVQRGLSAVNLATPSIGGTMNIITSPAEMSAGSSAKFEYGSGSFLKTTLSGHTGLINDKIAASVSVVRKVGDGVYDATWTDAWAYYAGLTVKLSDKHKLEAFAMGAPQRHGQNSYMQNIAAYGHDIARNIEGYNEAALDAFPEADPDVLYPNYDDARGMRYYNEVWGPVSESYDGKQWWNGKERERHAKDFINERENYYHKPLANLNWYATWTRKVKQYTVLYYSGGQGGGSGTYGSMRWNYHGGITSPSRFVHFDETIAMNMESDTARGILRNSINNQWTVGALSKVQILFSDNFKAQVGVDWRTAEIAHFREVRDLLGGKFFYHDRNMFESGTQYNKGLGDIIDYNFTNTVDWGGAFLQGEYSDGTLTAYATLGASGIKYGYTNHFVADPNDASKELQSESDFITGYQIKGGLSYKVLDGLSFYGNFGLVSKVPIFDAVIDDRSATVAEEPINETFQAVELGTSFSTAGNDLHIKANYYYTNWKNRTLNFGIINQDGSEGFVFVQGLNQLHTGFELEIDYYPVDFLSVGAIASIGNWNYTSDVTGTYKDYSADAEEVEYSYYVDGLKVGDAPQTQFGVMLAVMPIKDLKLQVDYRYNTNYFADWDPTTRTNADDEAQVWQVPAFGVMNAHLNYELPLDTRLRVELFGHVFNVLDEIYIQDAVDNSAYNAYRVDGAIVNPHSPDAAEVFLGMPRTFNVGLRLSY